MRIVFVVSGLLYGGTETQIINLARQLSVRGHAVAIYTLNDKNPRLGDLDGSGVKVVVDQKKASLDPLVWWRLRQFIINFRADIVHGFLYDGDFYSRLACIGTGIAALSSERSDQYSQNLNQKIGHWFSHRFAAGVVANSQSGARFSRKLYGFAEERMHVVWNGIDLAKVDARIKACSENYKQMFFNNSNVKVACFVGNIKPAKDYLLALKTADVLTKKSPDWRVLFLGDQLSNTGDYKALVQKTCAEIGLEERACFAGMRRDVIEIMGQCDALFSTSVREGFPNAVLEAMAAGLPVVSTDYSDIRLILPQSWQVVSDRSPESLVEALLNAYSSKAALAAEQRTWVEQNATVDVAAMRLETVYRRYVGKP